jgi:flagellar biogenesis protein FliO
MRLSTAEKTHFALVAVDKDWMVLGVDKDL